MRLDYTHLNADIWIAEHFAKTNMPMEKLFWVLKKIKETAYKVCDRLFARSYELRHSILLHMYWLKQVLQLSAGFRIKPKGEYNSNTSKRMTDRVRKHKHQPRDRRRARARPTSINWWLA